MDSTPHYANLKKKGHENKGDVIGWDLYHLRRDMKSNIQNLYRKTVGKRLFGTLEDDVKIDLKKTGM
jgi:hypothetical protein